MSFLEIVLISVALAVDAFSVGSAIGLNYRKAAQVFRVAFHFGLFQSLMSFAGVVGGKYFLSLIKQWDHWVAFALLSAIGIKMLYDHFRKEKEDVRATDPTAGLHLIALSTAVSIDALAAGVGLASVNVSIALTVITIGVVSFIATAVSMVVSGGVGSRLGKRMMPVAGLVLIGLGIKIVFDHIY